MAPPPDHGTRDSARSEACILPRIPQERALAEEPTLFDGKYTILAKLREGGMGTIYKVHHNLLDEIRVIKFMRAAVIKDPDLHRRFLQEAKLVTRFKHPNIAAVYDFAIGDDETAYIVMEYVDGLNLSDAVAALRPLSIAFVLEVTSQTLDALAYLHRKNVVHRDISPDNIMVVLEDGRLGVKLIDLGIAKALDSTDDLTKTGFFLGKLKYASPEQLGSLQGDDRLDGRSDLYSLGVAMYELLTGRLPFSGSSAQALIAGHLVETPAPFELSDPGGRIPLDVRNLVLKSLEKNRAHRFASAEEFREAILRIQQQLRLGAAQIETDRLRTSIEQAAAATVEGEAVTPSAQERMNRQFNLAEPTPPPGGGSVVPAGRTIAETRVSENRGTVPVAGAPLTDATVAVEERVTSQPPGVSRAWLAASATAAVALVALGITILRSDPSPAVNPNLTATATTAAATVTSSTAPPSPASPPVAGTATSSPVETTTTAVTASMPAGGISPVPEPGADPDEGPRRAATQARTLSATARANALALDAQGQPAFRRGTTALRDAEALVARGRFEAGIAKYNEASRHFGSAEEAARASRTRPSVTPPVAIPIADQRPPVAANPPDVPSPRPVEPVERPREDPPKPEPRPASPSSAEDDIRDTVREYVSAQEDLDPDRYVRVFPSADRGRIAAAFRSFRSQDLDLRISSIQVNGSRATVRADETRVAVPRAGTVQRINAERTFTLERNGGRWVIVSIR